MQCWYASLRKESNVFPSLQSGSDSAPIDLGDGIFAGAVFADVLLQLLVGLRIANHRAFLESRQLRQLLRVDVYWQTLLRSMWIAARVTIFSLLLGYPLAYFLSFYAGKKKDLFYQLVIIPLWVSYLVRAYAWKTILGRRRAQHFAAICT
jgi:ABC-type spermidine/putrescine transport system permease subunit I